MSFNIVVVVMLLSQVTRKDNAEDIVYVLEILKY